MTPSKPDIGTRARLDVLLVLMHCTTGDKIGKRQIDARISIGQLQLWLLLHLVTNKFNWSFSLSTGELLYGDSRTVSQCAKNTACDIRFHSGSNASQYEDEITTLSRVIIIKCTPLDWISPFRTGRKLWDGNWLPPIFNKDDPNSVCPQARKTGHHDNKRTKAAGAAAIATCSPIAFELLLAQLIMSGDLNDPASSPTQLTLRTMSKVPTYLPSWSLLHSFTGSSTIMEHLTELGDIRLTDYGAHVSNMVGLGNPSMGVRGLRSLQNPRFSIIETISRSILNTKPEHELLEEAANLAFSILGTPWAAFATGLLAAIKGYRFDSRNLTNEQLYSYNRAASSLGCKLGDGPSQNEDPKDFVTINAKKIIVKQSLPKRSVPIQTGSVQVVTPFLLLACISSLQLVDALPTTSFTPSVDCFSSLILICSFLLLSSYRIRNQ